MIYSVVVLLYNLSLSHSTTHSLTLVLLLRLTRCRVCMGAGDDVSSKNSVSIRRERERTKPFISRLYIIYGLLYVARTFSHRFIHCIKAIDVEIIYMQPCRYTYYYIAHRPLVAHNSYRGSRTANIDRDNMVFYCIGTCV